MDKLIQAAREALAAAIEDRAKRQSALIELREKVDSGGVTRQSVDDAIAARDAADALVRERQGHLDQLVREAEREAEVTALSQQLRDTEVPVQRRTATVEVVRGEAAYRPDTDPDGSLFLRDLAAAVLTPWTARDSVDRIVQQHRASLDLPGVQTRAAGTSAFAGLTIPAYLTEMVASSVTAGRPLADACTRHPLPDAGMTVEISRITTGTTAAVQSTQNTNVAEQDIDDTPLSIPVLTIAGRQTLSRQAIERSTGAGSVMVSDLMRQVATRIDAELLTRATVGLGASATAIAYTDASPTVAELWPRIVQGAAAVEAALLDQQAGDTIAVMHSRRWHWLQQGLSASFPLIGQPGIAPQNVGTNFGARYGSGFRGLLPSGMPVIVSNNVPTNLGAGTNEDEIYLLSQPEAHLWEGGPVLINAEQVNAQSLGVTFVAYQYIAFTFGRLPHAQRVGGTGLVTPAWTGV